MSKPTENLVEFPRQSTVSALDKLLRIGAQRLLSQAIEDEVASYLSAREQLVDESGRRQVVRNGHLTERTIQTPLGELPVKQPRVRDRRSPTNREVYRSSLLLPYLRKTKLQHPTRGSGQCASVHSGADGTYRPAPEAVRDEAAQLIRDELKMESSPEKTLATAPPADPTRAIRPRGR